MEYSQVKTNDIESATQERRIREEKKFEKKCHLCICYSLLCFACFMLVQSIIAIIMMYYNDEENIITVLLLM